MRTASRIILLAFFLGLISFVACHEPKGDNNTVQKTKDTLVYLNHSDTAKYVGINTCKLCHQSIYNTFIKTGMGKSFDLATKEKSVGDYLHSSIFDKISDLHYSAFWNKDSLEFLEYRLNGKDTSYKRSERVDYIIGSGQHTNSHIQSTNGYLNQMPMTFYAQKKQWDLPPGFENGHNTRFTRKIGLECMSCHNALPQFVLGSENKYTEVPQGINCERCHGPGSIHVAQRSTGSKIDTSKYIDYSIVNPSKLSIDAQFDICQRCHLQGNAILKEGKSFYDFKPGMKLSDMMTVFLPKYKNADDEFIMASHADRLKQSQCFIKSYAKAGASTSSATAKSLKPYKEALTCVTCHNPHVSVRETNKEVFNDACRGCHYVDHKSELKCSDKTVSEFFASKPTPNSELRSPNCTSCHMPKSGSTDIPHVTVHDHYIRKPISKEEKDKIKTFIGLYAINEKNPDRLTKAKAYINQYEKFDQKAEYLDSASIYMKDKTKDDILKNLQPLIQLEFIKQNFSQILNYVKIVGQNDLLQNILTKRSYDNSDAWTCYRIGESCFNVGQVDLAISWYEKAIDLAPYNLEFHNKLGTAYLTVNNLTKAKNEFNFIIKENPKFISAYTNLGYLMLLQNKAGEAEALYNKALQLDPDYEALLLNLAGLKAYKKDFKGAVKILEQILKKNPSNEKAKTALQQLKRFA